MKPTVRTTLRGGWLYTPAKCVVRDLLPPRDLPPVGDPQPNGTLQGTEGHRTHPSPTLVAGCGVDCGLWTRRKVFPHRDVPHFRERWRATFRAVMHRRSKKRVMPTNRSRLPPSPQHFLCQPLTPIPPPPPPALSSSSPAGLARSRSRKFHVCVGMANLTLATLPLSGEHHAGRIPAHANKSRHGL